MIFPWCLEFAKKTFIQKNVYNMLSIELYLQHYSRNETQKWQDNHTMRSHFSIWSPTKCKNKEVTIKSHFWDYAFSHIFVSDLLDHLLEFAHFIIAQLLIAVGRCDVIIGFCLWLRRFEWTRQDGDFGVFQVLLLFRMDFVLLFKLKPSYRSLKVRHA